MIVGDDGSRASTFDLLFGAAVLKIFFLENRALKNTYYIMMCVCVLSCVSRLLKGGASIGGV